MPGSISNAQADHPTNSSEQTAEVREIIERAAELLPAQGPITAFAFLNTLQALEHLPFEQGLKEGARLFGCQPFLTEDRFREKQSRGRIRPEDLREALQTDLGERGSEPIGQLTTRLDLRLAMLQRRLRFGSDAELHWHLAATDALKRMHPDVPPATRERFLTDTMQWVLRDGQNESSDAEKSPPAASQLLASLFDQASIADISQLSDEAWEAFCLKALWRVCRQGVHDAHPNIPPADEAIRLRDTLYEATGADSDTLVHPVLIRFCAAFLDQGFARWALPSREQGFFQAFCDLYRPSASPPDLWLAPLPAEIKRIETAGLTPLASIVESLHLLGIPVARWKMFLTRKLLVLRGWAATIWQAESRSDRVAIPALQGSLVGFLAIRLVLDRLALTHLARESLGYAGPLSELRHVVRRTVPRTHELTVDQRALLVFVLALPLGWTPRQLFESPKADWITLVTEIESFMGVERRRLYQLAFELHYRRQVLDAISIHARRPARPIERPRFQAAFCIDAREESFRRHLAEIEPLFETYGAAGFFSVPMYYRGIADAHFSMQSPIVVKPRHWIVEEAVLSLAEEHQRRAKTRRAVGTASHTVHVGSRGMAAGALLTAGLGVLASIPLVARVLFPRITARIRERAGRFLAPPRVTRLRLERTHPDPGPTGEHIGFSVPEMTEMGERLLRDIGLTANFARLVMFIGHGSAAMNNPHKSCYDCGACTGSAGGPNGRALAAILNDHRVREGLVQRGIVIPPETYFLGGQHSTVTEDTVFFDIDLLPASHVADYKAAQQLLAEAGQRNAHERCRRFYSAPFTLTYEQAKLHVEERAEDLAQTRPEFGNASNAVVVVGRHARSRGLFLDRRSFLVSYDPTQDDADSSILARVLGAVVPVCEGINMQYNLSYMDNVGWGAGSKLPHNVTSLLGVMDGHASDLRTGLPWQGVEIHEPMRLVFIIETTPRAILAIMERNAWVGRILGNGWVQLVVLDPLSHELQVFHKGTFSVYQPEASELPQVAASIDWYRGWREHLGFAQIRTGPAVAGVEH